jgi:membrane-associated phospholipid phosphatase
MHFLHALLHHPAWGLITRLGEAEILLPAAALTALALLAKAENRPLALRWLLLLGVATALTVASKVAFIGWGLGWAVINFTGLSGHAMFSAAVYPVLLASFVPDRREGTTARYGFIIALGYGVSLLIGISRIAIGAHSVSEVLAGLLAGGAASALTLAWSEAPTRLMRPLVPVVLVAWMALTPLQMPASRTHDFVTRLALAMSGHDTPFTRHDLLRQASEEDS